MIKYYTPEFRAYGTRWLQQCACVGPATLECSATGDLRTTCDTCGAPFRQLADNETSIPSWPVAFAWSAVGFFACATLVLYLSDATALAAAFGGAALFFLACAFWWAA